MRIGNYEIFEAEYESCDNCGGLQLDHAQPLQHENHCSQNKEEITTGSGWFYWCCSPGCLPEGDPIGPFESETSAKEDAEQNDYFESEES